MAEVNTPALVAWTVVFALGAYSVCGIPFGLIIARSLGHVDVRSTGSGNIGTTNVARSVGKLAAGLTLLCDLGKGLLWMMLSRFMLSLIVFGHHGFAPELDFASEAGISMSVIYLFCVFGHVFSPYLDFHGGKGIAVGVRLEHPSALIDQIQYHNPAGRGKYLPAAEYSFVTQVDGRGVYSFCMCPGGFVIPAASGPEQLVTNGMSPANRGSKWSNSGMVVQLEPEDIDASVLETENGPLDDTLRVMAYQEQLERLCWQQGNYEQTAPAQRMADFVSGRLSASLPASSYAPGLISSPLHFWLPQGVSGRLREAFGIWGRQKRGFLTNEATVIGVETRTSSPVRITRLADSLQHVSLQGLFPCGEGAGYAGGIVSAGVDGERCAEACAEWLSE